MTNITAIYQGELNSLDQIKVSPLSRAYTFSDSIYEVIPYFSGKPLCYEEHLDRMMQSAHLMSLNVNFESAVSDIQKLAATLSNQDGYVYYQISRGVDLIRSHLYQDDLEIERFGYGMPARFPSSAISAMLCEDDRWGKCNIKSTSLLGNVLAMNKAKSQGCQEVVMHRDGFMTEAGASNVFYFDSSGSVRTSSLSENILPGITRQILIKALENTLYSVKEGSCAISDFHDAPCIWLTSSTKGMLPLKNLIGTDYKLEENYKGYLDVVELFNSAMKLHLEVLE
ncbi:aminotransferase class IV [Gammaproteobacteria bacterium]|jgi:D-alanine transaminase|nr:aminotransferase class IV [Gammaproteobacteria bacterium]MDB0010128.1 aminotransferase class IV [Gammaproteobacteria bacterium]MDB2369980.1 aminotransferase class IV [Gammaproteobacteria bacterium]MDB2410876.1 aminotransferase class IV [Gammaproteobacteria bacterium]MDB2611972.1 aminotransferase class IV [Gammaproteobacteria bacterium]|tara:strand:- start:269 stop:1117 length:849 start_codon:yes stop_codon:yes gene_type:complete